MRGRRSRSASCMHACMSCVDCSFAPGLRAASEGVHEALLRALLGEGLRPEGG